MTHVISPTIARRLAVMAQQLDGRPAIPTKEAILTTIQQIHCVQLDPINVVARSPLLVLWSRLGHYDVADLHTLLWEERVLFEYWAHAASIVLTEDYPLHQMQMVNFATSERKGAQRVRAWMANNASFRDYVLTLLAEQGPQFVQDIEDKAVVPWQSDGWTKGRNVGVMLNFLWEGGEIMVSKREGAGFGTKKQWGLFDHLFPQWIAHEPLPAYEVVYDAAQKSLQALGVGTLQHINNHFIRKCYPGLEQVVADLLANGCIETVEIRENGRVWPGTWYIHQNTLPYLAQLNAGDWASQTVLLSPFDNLICDRTRTETLFDFVYRSEIYTPKSKRQYGYYVLPILHDGRLIGRIDPKMDRKQHQFVINALFFEPDVLATEATVQAIKQTIDDLAEFLGAREIRYKIKLDHLPPNWRPFLRQVVN